MMTFNAIDVETANHSRWSICQIGICSVINGEIGDQWETLVNPETDFIPFNVRIHGIQKADVKTRLWREIGKEIGNAVKVTDRQA